MRPSQANNKKQPAPSDGNKHPTLADVFDELDFEYATGVAEKAMQSHMEQTVRMLEHFERQQKQTRA